MAANHDRALTPREARALTNKTATDAQLTVELDESGDWSLRPRAIGFEASFGNIVAEVVCAMTIKEWTRLKVCVNDTCRWAFYDHSRARTGRWCSMQNCGNQAKQKNWRSRHSPTSHHGH